MNRQRQNSMGMLGLGQAEVNCGQTYIDRNIGTKLLKIKLLDTAAPTIITLHGTLSSIVINPFTADPVKALHFAILV